MSGFDERTGIFDLNWNKIERYLPHRYNGSLPNDYESIAFELIEKSGYIFLGKTSYGFKLVANDAQIWELISDEPATFSHTEIPPEVIYEKWKNNKKWFNATDLSKEMKPKLSAIKVNRYLENLGYIEHKDGGWVPTKLSINKGLVREREGANIYDKKPCVELNSELLSILRDDL